MADTKVVILNWNGRRHLERFLPSVVTNTPEEVNVVVADNGSDDDSCEYIRREFPRVRVLELGNNYGFAEGYNRALAALESDYFILLNSDVETPPGWCEPLISALEADRRLAAVSPKMLSYERPEMFEYAGASGGFIDRWGYPFCRGRILSTLERDTGQYDDFRYVFWATGACMAVRSSVFSETGGFDGSFFAHMEEIDFCWRAQLYGYKIAVQPASRVYHLGGGTLSADDPRKLYLNFRNNLAMMQKNLPARKVRTRVFLRMCLDGLSALIYLAGGKKDSYRAVRKAHRDFKYMRPELMLKRAEIPRTVKTPLDGVYKGSIILRYIVGGKTFGNLL